MSPTHVWVAWVYGRELNTTAAQSLLCTLTIDIIYSQWRGVIHNGDCFCTNIDINLMN